MSETKHCRLITIEKYRNEYIFIELNDTFLKYDTSSINEIITILNIWNTFKINNLKLIYWYYNYNHS
jgi:hypothetical protein